MLIITSKSIVEDKLSITGTESSRSRVIVDVNDGEVYIQTPRVTFTPDLEITLDPSNSRVKGFYKTLRKVEAEIRKILAEKSGEWFPKQLSDEVMKGLFKSAVEVPEDDMEHPMTIRPEVSDKLQVFGPNEKPLTREDIHESKECTFLLHLRSVTVTANQAKVDWDLVQVLAHPRKGPKGFAIQDTSDEYPAEKLDMPDLESAEA